MAAHTQIQPPNQFHFRNPEGWIKWIQRFERYRIATELNLKGDEQQINTLLYMMGDEVDEIMKSFTFKKDNDKIYEKVKEKLLLILVPHQILFDN